MNNFDWQDLEEGGNDWTPSDTDSGYYDSDNEAGNPGSWLCYLLTVI